jgi:magnesium transporter
MEETTITPKDVKAWVADRRLGEIRSALPQLAPAESAEILRELAPPERAVAFRALPREYAADVFAELSPAAKDGLLGDLSEQETRRLLGHMAPDDRTELFEEMPDQVTQRLLKLLSPDDLREARQLLGYPEESVGRLMTPDFIAVGPEDSVGRALERIRKQAEERETVHTVFVTDDRGKLLGYAALGRLVAAPEDRRVQDLIDPAVVSIRAREDQEEAARLMERHDLEVLAVVGPEGVLLGVATVDDILDVVEEEATEDIHSLGAVGHGPAPGLRTGLREATFGMIYRARVPWLLLLVFMNIFSGTGIAYFEDTLETMIALAFFLPLLIDSGGNAGTQSATLMVRALATGDVRLRDWLQMFSKELAIALALGLTMALAVFGIGVWRGGTELAWIVSFTMVGTVTFGSLVGMLLPFGLERFDMDPATASAPLVTSIADIGGVLIYFSLATWMLGL